MADATISGVSSSLGELLTMLGSPQALVEAAPSLTVSAALRSQHAFRASPALGERRSLAAEGFAALRSAIDERTSSALAIGIEELRKRDFPATFLYAFDEAWLVGEAVRSQVSSLLGHEYRLVEDVWAWRIAPGQGGWPPHRGLYDAQLARDAPEILNAWVALSEVTADRACMHAVPLDEDPGYPAALERVDAPLSAVRALPAKAGDALFWNANLLHWGGRCAAQAAAPRVSCSFTLCRSDTVDRFPALPMLRPLGDLDFATRMDVVAHMIATYGADQPDVTDMVRQWASLAVALSARLALRKTP
jgi:ectoine hydroxylase-related dioxygenase (phytanoyl-CoA dioxygenase family)